MRQEHPWVEQLPAAVTVTDADGTILILNDAAREAFADAGGEALVGSSVFDCHPEPARSRTVELYERRRANHYTVRKAGRRSIVHQLPWQRGGRFAGFVELVMPIPEDLPHFDRE